MAINRFSGLLTDNDEALHEGDTISLLGVKGKVCICCGAWGWGSHKYVPWEELEKRIPHGNNPAFCYNDNFISFWELIWNFSDEPEPLTVPFIQIISKSV